MEEIIDIHGFKRQIPSVEEIRAEVIEEVCELVVDYLDGYWFKTEDEFKEYVKEQLKEQK